MSKEIIIDWTFISVIIAIFTFLITEKIKSYQHKKKQMDLLKCLKFKIEEIEIMLNSYKKAKGLLIPFYKLPLPDESFYFRNLDFKIKNKTTIDLKYYVNRIQDKCLIINYMIEEMLKEWNNSLNKKGVQKNVLNYYYPKIAEIVNDWQDKKGLPYSINKVQCILHKKFKI
jgi:hypothetical protein